ncbi:MAG: SusD/RagB family nutrient-binding outer membrane lipoprotein, partial [Saprospiraceae bacterium]|nr:SusD/RagB family nutrient-binding outer membrane lipoprotein [Saprospiraceae bacterium]
MKKTGYWNKLLIAFSLVFVLGSCNLFELDINDDPNNPTTAAINLLLSQAELSLADALEGAVNDNQLGFAGILASGDNFQLAQNSYDGFWNNMYAGPLKDIEGIIQIASNPDALSPHYLGIGQLLKAYAFSTMVDLFGDVPYSEALKGDAADAIKAPKFDDQEAIYADALALIDAAIANLSGTTPVAVSGDIIYGGNSGRWLKFARSLKLKLLMQTRQVSPTAKQDIEKVFTDGGLISTAAEDFQFQFSKLQSSNDVRHSWYENSYTLGVNNFGYLLHQYMVEMLEDKDPRFPFYFRRQTKTILDQNDPSQRNTTPCSMTPGCIYGYVVLNSNLHQRIYGTTSLSQAQIDFLAGVFGRDRADPAGVPQDADFRTMPGVYPAAGRYDVTAPGLPGS